jgi:hypothetical protein|tara:strand:- start:92 stop:385 length:294 start_codon:yes stop_codon:yes gene_type:complete
MNDRQKVACWSGMRIPTDQLRLANAAALLEGVAGDVEGMFESAADMSPPFYTQGNVVLGTDLAMALGELERAVASVSRARAYLENCTVLSDKDGNPV